MLSHAAAQPSRLAAAALPPTIGTLHTPHHQAELRPDPAMHLRGRGYGLHRGVAWGQSVTGAVRVLQLCTPGRQRSPQAQAGQREWQGQPEGSCRQVGSSAPAGAPGWPAACCPGNLGGPEGSWKSCFCAWGPALGALAPLGPELGKPTLYGWSKAPEPCTTVQRVG